MVKNLLTVKSDTLLSDCTKGCKFTGLLVFWKLLDEFPFVLVLVNLEFVDIVQLRLGLDLTQNILDPFV